MTQTSPLFDAESDVAAMVYGSADDPDGALTAFVEDLRRSGAKVAGLIQSMRGPAAHANGTLSAVLLHSGEEIPLRHEHVPQSNACRLEPRGLAHIAAVIAEAVHDGADLVVVNRFGKHELDGGGLLREIAAAIETDVPALIAVPEWNFTAWTAYCGGMSVKLACRSQSLHAWWRSVRARSPEERRGAKTLCEIAK